VVVRPVIDLNARASTPAYDVPDRMREQVVLRDRTCVFPWCARSARGCDLDHVVEFDHGADSEGRAQPGPTATWNLAPLCRRHHRLKTFTAWTYRVVGPGAFHWTSPHGRRYRRDQTGTSSLDPPDRS
jgi:5-methylcytosine-specific restriction endonuclease McrA